MKFYEYGKENNLVIILIHGAGCSNYIYDTHAQIWKDKYHVILPVLDGHGEEYNQKYISTEATANRILRYINDNCGGSIYALYGFSLGGQIVLELLNCNPNIARKIIIESTVCFPQKILRYYSTVLFKIKNIFICAKKVKNLRGGEEDITNGGVAVVQKESMLNILNTYYKYHLKDNIKETKADVAFWYGEKDFKCIKKSAKLVKMFIPSCQIEEFQSYIHGEFSIYHPCEFVIKAEKLFSK